MKQAKMTRIDVLQARITAMQEEIAQLHGLQKKQFNFPMRCTEATVNAALEAAGCERRVRKTFVAGGVWAFVVLEPNGAPGFMHYKTAKLAFENIVRHA
ncbi:MULTISPECIES: hypothetical protein [Comamonas]|uniref:hypothetical protein n=1 Tax=Comamonas TaxID=283 RepID=UPI0025C685DA|nr:MULTISPECIES: hypothetical protein [Comamonas]